MRPECVPKASENKTRCPGDDGDLNYNIPLTWLEEGRKMQVGETKCLSTTVLYQNIRCGPSH